MGKGRGQQQGRSEEEEGEAAHFSLARIFLVSHLCLLHTHATPKKMRS